MDGTATKLTAHYWLQNLCPLLGADRPPESHKLMPCFLNWSHYRVVTEMIYNNKDKKEEQSWNATKISPSEVIHTIVKSLFQQLSTAFVAAHWQKALEQYQPRGPSAVSKQHVVVEPGFVSQLQSGCHHNQTKSYQLH